MSEILKSAGAAAWPWGRIAHGAAAYAIVLFTAFIVLSAVNSVAQSLLAAQAELTDRAQNIAALETALQTKQEALAQNLNAIGEEEMKGTAELTPQQTLARLNADADALSAALQAKGFRVTARSPAVEIRINPTLSRRQTSLVFTGDTQAAAGLMSDLHAADARLASLTLDVTAAAAVLKADLVRIGAATPSGDADLGGGDE